MNVFRGLHASSDEQGRNRLTSYIHRKNWPYESPPEFFYMAATAANKTSCLPFLIGAYEAAIVAAATISNMSLLVLQVALVKLYTNCQYDFAKAEPLVSGKNH